MDDMPGNVQNKIYIKAILILPFEFRFMKHGGLIGVSNLSFTNEDLL